MNDNFLLRKIIIYGMGVICVCAWAIFRIIPYNIAMYLTTAIFAYSMFIESKQDKLENRNKKAMKKMGFCVLLIVCLVLILLLNP